ncbi:hypothetical protein ACFY0F_10990 [Streptomyces sp. NPDC001544]|uniref:hypothetical protein n=1 Tax=Streptomyces sp. NPDC001544 TaxID=3364584 RepID=UPI0036C5F071
MTNTRSQLRSTTVVLGGVGVLAAALTACSSDPDKRCVDRDSYNAVRGYKVVSDKNCKSGSPKTSVHGVWYYGGKRKSGWVDGGSFTKGGGKGSGGSDDDNHRSGVHRGGFGGGKGGSGG